MATPKKYVYIDGRSPEDDKNKKRERVAFSGRYKRDKAKRVRDNKYTKSVSEQTDKKEHDKSLIKRSLCRLFKREREACGEKPAISRRLSIFVHVVRQGPAARPPD